MWTSQQSLSQLETIWSYRRDLINYSSRFQANNKYSSNLLKRTIPYLQDNRSNLAETRIQRLTQIKAVVLGSPTDVLTKVYLVPKKEPNDYRLIQALTNVNCGKVELFHFKFEQISKIAKHLVKGSWAYKLDLLNDYYHLKIHKSIRHLYGFQVFQQFYRSRALPFGDSDAPRVFQKLMKPAVQAMRVLRFYLYNLLDDFFGAEKSLIRAQQAILTLLNIFQDLKLSAKEQKCTLHPVQDIIWLGIGINFKEGFIYLPQDKVCKMLTLVNLCLNAIQNNHKITFALLESLKGRFIHATTVIAALKVVCAQIQVILNPILTMYNRQIVGKVQFLLPASFKPFLLWAQDLLQNRNCKPFELEAMVIDLSLIHI